MAKVGTGTISLENTDTMTDTITRLLKVTNSSNLIVQRKIERLKSTEVKSKNMKLEDEYGAAQENSQPDVFINEIKKEYVLNNLMATVSSIPDYLVKVCNVIYLMTKEAHIKYNEYFKLKKINTEYAYINEDNMKINDIINDIVKEVFISTKELDDVVANFRSTVNPAIAEFMKERYTDLDILRFKTGAFYKALSRKFGEKFTPEEKEIVSKFLSDFKRTKHNIVIKPLDYYLTKFGITKEQWKEQMTNYKALSAINDISAFDWLSTYE
jgi:hypothetical protein